MFPGIADRMHKELTSLAPLSMKVRSPDRPGISSRLTPFFAGQDRRTTRTKILSLDRWFYPCLAQHIPKFVVFQARV